MACDNCINCTCGKKYYVKVQSAGGNHKLFESASRKECIDFMWEWAGENATQSGPDKVITALGDVVFIDSISPAQEEVWEIRECWKYDEAIEHFCKNNCQECRFYESFKCLIKESFGKL